VKVHIRTSLRMVAVTLVLTGLVYPLLVSGLAQLTMPQRANGSLIARGGTIVGSSLIGQSFRDPGHLQPRPSAAGAGYDATASGGSNLGPTSATLRARVIAEVARLRAENPDAPGPVPVALVTTSASGLDPHLSPAAALWQAPRIAAARRLPVVVVEEIIRRHVEGRMLGFLGEPRVNVLGVNLALDAQSSRIR
jgi:potassium-transporting ATPase KdpC subunit